MKTGAEGYAEVQAMKPLDIMAFLSELPKIITGAAELVQTIGLDTPWHAPLLADMAEVEAVMGELIRASRAVVTHMHDFTDEEVRLSRVMERIA